MQQATPDDPGHGLVVYRASRLEALLDPLERLLHEVPPAHALAPQTVIAAHPGMRQWLAGALARKRGPGSIVANLDIRLPSDWLDALAREVLGESAVALRPYRRERLRWRIHELLGGLDDPQLRRYLAGGDPARRRYQLADRLARLYSQYLVYRPDWLAAWERGRDGVPEQSFLAPLWRALRRAIDRPHRAEVLDALLRALDRAPPGTLPREPLHVFGLSHLAPAELAVLAAVARHRPVVLYVPDPCREYWAGLRGTRAQLRELAARLDAGDTAEAAFIGEAGHPLLADWGRMGQHFMLALSGLAEVRTDVRHWQDEDHGAPPPVALLHQLQESIRRLDVSLLQPARGEAALRDRSLRVHLCHTRLRELEVLRDALLRELAERPDLQPSDIVVMAPDIAAYVPLLPAVFGEAGRMQGPLPYHLADVAVARTHPLLDAFGRLLDTPGSRLTAPQVLDLLQTPAIARALGLDGDDVERLGQWLAEARVAWGLDGAWRAGFGVPAIAGHTFAWGLDRLLAGYVMGGGDAAFELPGGALWPVAGVSGPQAAALGALDRLLQELAALRRDAAVPRRASAWAARLEQLLDALFRVAPDDRAGREALGLLRRFIHATVAETQDAGLDPELDFAVVREVLRERLAAAPERQRFLLGGVTFCGMVPQRAIPFRVVAVLGLNDGEFPRGAGDQGLDPMLRHRRLGDRDVRSDDRYLFLETVMAARDALHLSYLGEGVRDGKSRNPAAPLAELLALLDAQAGLAEVEPDADDRARAEGRADAPVLRPWRVRHPLQPFDARYFDGSDPRLFSYRGELAAMVSAPAARAAPPAAAAEAAPDDTAALREVLAWYRDPAKQLLRQRLNVRLDALEEERLRESEPLEARFEALDRVGRRLVLDALEGGLRLPARAPDWLRLTGLLPPGRLGEAAWQREREQAEAMLARARDLPLLRDGLPPRLPLAVQETLAGLRVEGELSRVHERAGVRWLFEVFPGRKEAQLGFRERVPLFVEWALLRRLTPPDAPVRLALLTSGGEAPWQAQLNGWDAAFVAADAAPRAAMLDDLGRRLAGLLELWLRAQRQPPLWYFPRTSWSVVEDLQRGREPRPLAAWQGGGHGVGERDHAPGYAHLLAGEARFEPGRPEYDALVEIAARLAALIAPEPPA
ncbi:exodeoxyribonuclease V subunit gamma [Fulvimonas soli]|uniref:RecBCD enzyme subunit RecC n=1 Tax=Fulvimonas soli TaxID=155197 RepID=A0A316HWS1_9GAMM|nr:exodeoxyribonuclease V subunit gamma [Fulvimonas soli]PWK82730.1 DNA helicase/exodeoxyribonuclease V gamma subunit [Fulvimonas soli]TNY26106.1 exodeoxyribonuclease V subunit gamma [Fulvimonas soli]